MSIQNVVAPFDPTAYTSISGAQLKQLVEGLKPYTDKGFVIVTNDLTGDIPQPPNPNGVGGDPSWVRYIWIRISSNTVTPYIWNQSAGSHTDGSGHDLINWYTVASATIGPNSITSQMIQPNAVQDVHISAPISASKLSGSLPTVIATSLVKVGDVAGGVLTGTYPNPTGIVNGSINTDQLADNAVQTAKIKDASITPAKILPSLNAKDILRTNAATPLGVEWVSPDIYSRIVKVKGLAAPGVDITGITTTATAVGTLAITPANIGNLIHFHFRFGMSFTTVTAGFCWLKLLVNIGDGTTAASFAQWAVHDQSLGVTNISMLVPWTVALSHDVTVNAFLSYCGSTTATPPPGSGTMTVDKSKIMIHAVEYNKDFLTFA